jgi:hypothetical protein
VYAKHIDRRSFGLALSLSSGTARQVPAGSILRFRSTFFLMSRMQKQVIEPQTYSMAPLFINYIREVANRRRRKDRRRHIGSWPDSEVAEPLSGHSGLVVLTEILSEFDRCCRKSR